MPLDVALGGVSWRWQLKDDHAVKDWLGRRPWLGPGGVLAVQVPDDEHDTAVELHTEVFAADRRSSDVRVMPVSISHGTLLTDALGTWMNTSKRSPRELALALADDLDVRPTVFILDARTARGTACTEDAIALVDLAAKLEVARCPTFIVLHGRGDAPLRGTYDLCRGWPVGLAGTLFDRAELEVWPRYLHLRLAWESGGVVDDSIDCSSIAGELAPEDDNALERVLNRFADAKFELMPESERDAWIRFVTAVPPAETAPPVFGVAEDCDGRMTPFPWLARALLLRGAGTPGSIRALRTEISCRPLHEQILNRCFAVEARLRGRLPEQLPPPPPDLEDALAFFATPGAHGKSLVAQLYPDGHPSPPNDAWDFASVGFVAKHVPTEGDEWRLFRSVRNLRNAAAHCHYMAWRAVSEARAIRGLMP